MSNEGNTMRNDLWAEGVGIPEYVCHKRVRAAKIAANLDAIDGSSVTIQLGEDKQPWVVTPDWFRKHTPEVGGYLVFYADGYVSYSLAKAFEEGYTRS